MEAVNEALRLISLAIETLSHYECYEDAKHAVDSLRLAVDKLSTCST
jgi:hypothetical protein